MTTLLLSRHGETRWHAENRYAGSSDVALTERGMAQADRLGRWAERQSLAAVYSSDLSRAVITATPAANALGLQLNIDPRLREVHFGAGEGLTSSEMRATFPTDLAAFQAAPGHHPLPGGEAGAAAVERVWPALEEIAAAHEGEQVLIVMHSTLMRLVLCRVLDMPLDRYRTAFPSVINTAITTISLDMGDSEADARRRPALHAYNVPTD